MGIPVWFVWEFYIKGWCIGCWEGWRLGVAVLALRTILKTGGYEGFEADQVRVFDSDRFGR
jgi:hypothetical protein